MKLRFPLDASERSRPLRSVVKAPGLLDDATKEEMFELLSSIYEGIYREQFLEDLGRKSHVILLTDDHDTLRGFSTLAIWTYRHRSRTVKVLFSGDTVIHPRFWGRKELQVRFTRILLEAKIRCPRDRFYWLLTTKGIRTYLLLVNYFPRSYPRYDQPTPSREADLIEALGRFLDPHRYDSAAGILRASPVAQRVSASLSPKELDPHGPHITFFRERNPGWASGDELVCVARVGWSDLIVAMCRALRKRARVQRRTRD